jgi:hypothetical protein
MAGENTCPEGLDCETAKLSLEQLIKRFLIIADGDCLAFKVNTVGRDVTINSATPTTDGTVTAGALAVTFTTSDDFVGSINGATRYANMSYTFDAKGGKTPAIPYVITAGSITIDKIL